MSDTNETIQGSEPVVTPTAPVVAPKAPAQPAKKAAGWKAAQQKRTGNETKAGKEAKAKEAVEKSKSEAKREAIQGAPAGGPKVDKDGNVSLLMKTDYRTFAKKGQIYKVDPSKAAELVKLGRATYAR